MHAEDIRRPLGIRHTYPQDAVREVLDFYQGSDALIGTKSRIAGVTLRPPTPTGPTARGPVAEGPLLSLLMAAPPAGVPTSTTSPARASPSSAPADPPGRGGGGVEAAGFPC